MTEELTKIAPTTINAYLKDNTVYQQQQYIKDLLKTDIRLNKVAEIVSWLSKVYDKISKNGDDSKVSVTSLIR